MLNQFSRTQLLLGAEAMEKLKRARVAVFGIGGVGGYVLLDISTNYDYVDSARRIETAEELCRLMLEDIALDVLLLTENEHSIETADPLERAEIVRRWQPYFEQLPEYEYLREELTSEWP